MGTGAGQDNLSSLRLHKPFHTETPNQGHLGTSWHTFILLRTLCAHTGSKVSRTRILKSWKRYSTHRLEDTGLSILSLVLEASEG